MAYEYAQYTAFGYVSAFAPPPTTPPPPPDKNWVDPTKVNKAYLKKIQKDFVDKEFVGLKQDMLFLMEVLTESIELKKEIADRKFPKENGASLIVTQVKFMNFPFLEVNKVTDTDQTTTDASEPAPAYLNLFQTIFTEAHRREALVEKNGVAEVKKSSAIISAEERKGTMSRNRVSAVLKEKKVSKLEDAVVKLEVMSGKSALLVMSGTEMIQSLQISPVNVKVGTRDVIVEDKITKSESLGACALRLPESFRQAVLLSIKPETELPSLVTAKESVKLKNSEGQEVGQVYLTINFTCLGKVVENCVRGEVSEDLKFQHTKPYRDFCFIFNTEEAKDTKPPKIAPKLALEVMQIDLPVRDQTSSEVLCSGICSKKVEFDADEIRHALRGTDCYWRMCSTEALLEDASKMTNLGPEGGRYVIGGEDCYWCMLYKRDRDPSKKVGNESYPEDKRHVVEDDDCFWRTMAKRALVEDPSKKVEYEPEMVSADMFDLDVMWKKQLKLNKDFLASKKVKGEANKDLFDRLEQVRVQTGVVELDTKNPFLLQEAPSGSQTEVKSPRPSRQSRRKSSNKGKL